MPTQISNQASLSFEYGTQSGSVTSNIATAILQDPINSTKTSLENNYYLDDEITYILSTVNNSQSEINNVNIIDNLGTYTLDSGQNATPLSYVGPAQMYINGNLTSEITPVVDDDSISFTVDSIPSNSNVMIIYKATPNTQAPLSIGSTITNTATWTIDGYDNTITDYNTITVRQNPDIRILKSMSPSPISTGEEIRYDFTIQNYGNIQATNLSLSDTFNPIPKNIQVYINNNLISSVNYSYSNGELNIPISSETLPLEISPATFIQDPNTGVITVTPGTLNITVIGIL